MYYDYVHICTMHLYVHTCKYMFNKNIAHQ